VGHNHGLGHRLSFGRGGFTAEGAEGAERKRREVIH
jgi:hypothetical protein